MGKKLLCFVILVTQLFFMFGCSINDELPTGTYVQKYGDEQDKAYFVLEENKEFYFTFRFFSSFFRYGTYEIVKNKLVVKSND